MARFAASSVMAVCFILSGLAGGTTPAAAPHFSICTGGSSPGYMPPPGLYFKQYNFVYFSDTYKAGSKSVPGDTKTFKAVSVQRVLLNTGKRFLGADIGGQLILPLVYAKVSADLAGTRGDKHRFGVGDLRFEPILQWYPTDRLSLLFSSALFIPVGDYRKNKAISPGSGSWGWMNCFGINYFFDEDKTIALNPFIRHEISSKEFSTDKRAGDYIHFEASLLKRWRTFSVAALFGGSWQVADGNGMGEKNAMRRRVLMVGPEIGYKPSPKTELQFKALFEFKNRNASQGVGIHMTFMKKF